MSAPAASEPAAPGAAPTISLSAADLAQLLEAAGKRVEADVSPSKIVAGVEAIPGKIVAGAKAVNWPLLIVALVAFAAFALHFPKLLPL